MGSTIYIYILPKSFICVALSDVYHSLSPSLSTLAHTFPTFHPHFLLHTFHKLGLIKVVC